LQFPCPGFFCGSAFRRPLAGASWGHWSRPVPKGACRGCRWRLPRRAVKERSYAPHQRGCAVAGVGLVPARHGKAEVCPLATWQRTVQTQSGRLVQQHLDGRAHAFGPRQRQPQQRQRERQTGRQQQQRLGGVVRWFWRPVEQHLLPAGSPAGTDFLPKACAAASGPVSSDWNSPCLRAGSSAAACQAPGGRYAF
jgi:hypothetical protein